MSSNRRRPADVYLPSWDFGTPAALDFAITSPQRQETLSEASLVAGAAAEHYEAHKRSYLNTGAECTQQGVAFIPMVAESSGGWGSVGLRALRKLAKAGSQRAARDDEAVLGPLLERLCVVIRSAKARAVLRRGGSGIDDPSARSFDAVRTALAASAA